jgi:predicted GNAT family N-acyltransferase
MIGSGSAVSYDGQFGFMGFFIVKPEHRGQGMGGQLWLNMRDTLKERLNPGTAIGIDGVFNMQQTYAKTGFVFSHRTLRMEGVAESNIDSCDLARHKTVRSRRHRIINRSRRTLVRLQAPALS